jgi:hypothetical protein
MAGLLGVLPAGLASTTTKVEEDIDSGPVRGCYRWVWQRPPPKLKTSMVGLPTVAPLKLKMTLMAGPLGVLPVDPIAATTEVEEDVDGCTCPLFGSPDSILCLNTY